MRILKPADRVLQISATSDLPLMTAGAFVMLFTQVCFAAPLLLCRLTDVAMPEMNDTELVKLLIQLKPDLKF
jgi:hypothetical protein